MSSYAGDAGTLLDGGIYNRKSKYDNNLQTSIVQKNIGDRIGNVVNHIKTSSVEEMEQGWNELIVENPKVAGLFYQKNEYGDAWIPPEAKKLSESLGLPLYVLDKDKIFLYDKETNAVSEVSRENMFDSSKDFSKEEKKNLIEGMIDKEAFNVKRENIYNFNAYNSGKGYFKFMKRIDSGERVEISYLNEDTVVEDGDDVIQLFSRNYIIKKNSIPEESWKGWIKENYEKHGLYYRQKQDYEKKSEDDKGYFFNPKFNEEGYAASGEFIMEGDNTASYINMLEKNFEELSSRQNEIKKEHGGSDIPLNKKALIFNLFGFAEECKKANDLKNYEKATKLVEKFGRVDECETFVEKRVGQDGKFQYLTDDAPVEVRKKLKELSVV